jgi:hypothetical protein
MNKLDFYKKAMAAKLYENKAWVISLMALINEGANDYKTNPYAYRIVQTPTMFYYCDPEKNLELSIIEDCVPGKPILHFKDPIEMKAGEIANLKTDIVTSVGNVFFNYCCIVHSFGTKMDFLDGEVSISYVEQLVADRMEDNDSTNPNAILVSEYLTFTNAAYYMTNFTQVCVNAGTPKSMMGPPGIAEFKKGLLEKHKDRLNDPETVATIDAELVKFDAAYLKGDESETFLISNKSKNIVRKKMFLMLGAEMGLEEKVGVDLITNSLAEGWQTEKWAAMNNSLRAGTFNRSAQTQLGGESVKWQLRASSNITITDDDCGSKLGKSLVPSKSTLKRLIGFKVIVDGKQTLVENAEQAGAYLGKRLMVRSPMYCKLAKTDYCKACVGARLSLNPPGISLTISEYGSGFLDIFMAAAHAKALLLAKMNYKEALT